MYENDVLTSNFSILILLSRTPLFEEELTR